MIIDINFKNTIQKWLFDNFNKYQFINELHLIGSVLHKLDINDVDIVQLINLESKESIKEYAKELQIIKSNFFNIFNIDLHITSFTNTELANFFTFISINNSIKII